MGKPTNHLPPLKENHSSKALARHRNSNRCLDCHSSCSLGRSPFLDKSQVLCNGPKSNQGLLQTDQSKAPYDKQQLSQIHYRLKQNHLKANKSISRKLIKQNQSHIFFDIKNHLKKPNKPLLWTSTSSSPPAPVRPGRPAPALRARPEPEHPGPGSREVDRDSLG